MNEFLLLDELYEVEKIVEGPNAKGECFIKWEGYPDDQNTWEPVEHLPEDMVEEYLNPMEELRVKTREDRRPKSKRKRKPGVDIAAVVDESICTGKEPSKTPPHTERHGQSLCGCCSRQVFVSSRTFARSGSKYLFKKGLSNGCQGLGASPDKK